MKKDRIIGFILFLFALFAVSALALITIFIFKEGVPFIFKIGFQDFFLNTDWHPKAEHPSYGISAMIIGSVSVTICAMILAAIFGLGCAIVLTQFCPRRLVTFLKPAIELLAGIPSVVYGFIGMVTLIPLIRHLFIPANAPPEQSGFSVLAAAIVLGIMVLPTVTSISVDALIAVPRNYFEGSIALGATRWQTTHMVMLRAARSGIVAAIILGMGRAIGETMAVIMVAGNAVIVPHSILDPVRTLTSNIALEMGYAEGMHRQALFATGVTLFIIIMILNTAALYIARQRAGRPRLPKQVSIERAARARA